MRAPVCVCVRACDVVRPTGSPDTANHRQWRRRRLRRRPASQSSVSQLPGDVPIADNREERSSPTPAQLHTMTLQAIRYENGTLEVLDQLLLPKESKYIPILGVEDGWKVINKMQVRTLLRPLCTIAFCQLCQHPSSTFFPS